MGKQGKIVKVQKKEQFFYLFFLFTHIPLSLLALVIDPEIQFFLANQKSWIKPEMYLFLYLNHSTIFHRTKSLIHQNNGPSQTHGFR